MRERWWVGGGGWGQEGVFLPISGWFPLLRTTTSRWLFYVVYELTTNYARAIEASRRANKRTEACFYCT